MNLTSAALFLSERMNAGSKSPSSPGGFLKRPHSFPLEAPPPFFFFFLSLREAAESSSKPTSQHAPGCCAASFRASQQGSLCNLRPSPPPTPRGSNKNISIISRSPISGSPRRLVTKSTDAFFFCSEMPPWAGGNHLKSCTSKVPKGERFIVNTSLVTRLMN